MGWLDQPKGERVARRGRREQRRRRVQTLETRLWDAKEQGARDDRDRAAVEYDYTRSQIAKVGDPAERGRLYRALHEVLEQFNLSNGWRRK